jgi:hypothetical protein
MVWEFFSARDWVEFDEALQVLGDYIEQAPTQLRLDSDAGSAVLDLMHLNAAEGSLRTGLRAPTPTRGPFLVASRPAAISAIYETDTGPFVGHDPRENPRLSDVTLFGSDASKLAWLSGTDSVAGIATRFIPTVTRLGNLHREFHDRRQEWTFHDPTFSAPTAFS